MMKIAPVESRRFSRSLHPKLVSAPATGMSTTVEKLQQQHLHETELSNPGTCRCTATGAQQPCQRTARRNLHGLLHSLHERATCHCVITAMSNSVDELRARHNHCHLNGLLELVQAVHRDQLSEDNKKHAISYTVHKAMNLYLGGSKSLCPRE